MQKYEVTIMSGEMIMFVNFIEKMDRVGWNMRIIALLCYIERSMWMVDKDIGIDIYTVDLS